MERRLHHGLQPGRRHGLRDSVRDSGDERFILPLLQTRVWMFRMDGDVRWSGPRSPAC